MATANSGRPGIGSENSSNSEPVLDAIRRKLGKVQANLESNYESVIQRILPGKRKGTTSRPSSLYDSEAVCQPFLEQIEMASLKQRGRGRGHQFVACHLNNPTWCDKCGDFIWGLYKQCQRCEHCQYTCHLNCIPAVTLDCTTVSPGSGKGPVATPTDLPSPSASVETCLTRPQRTIVSHRSPQKQQAASTSSVVSDPDELVTSTCAQPVAAPCCVSDHSNSAHHVACIREPLSGACVSRTTSLSSNNVLSPPSSSSVSSSSLSATAVCVDRDLNQNAKDVGDPLLGQRHGAEDVCDSINEKDETDSGYRSGTIPDDKLPKQPSQATLNRMEIQRKIQTFNHFVPTAALKQMEDGEAFQGFLRVTLNLIRPITMELGARPPSIYELLTREHIVEQSTQHIAFYMPRDTVKSIHITSKTTTKEVIVGLLNKFHILDHPRKFAMYEQEFSDKNKLVKLRRLTDKDFPLLALLSWEPNQVKHYRLVLQENETGEIVWDAFSQPELKNFLVVLDREENEAILQLQYKYRVMKRIINQRMKELHQEKLKARESTA